MKLPPDPDGMNRQRAVWAREALKEFMSHTLQKDEDEALGDLVCDLLHLGDEKGMSAEKILRKAGLYYEEETSNYGTTQNETTP